MLGAASSALWLGRQVHPLPKPLAKTRDKADRADLFECVDLETCGSVSTVNRGSL